ncbi:hypothetical protein [Pueribacillus sp. YX66]|uniref:hypothetical protein n=1 Tax=Pueribacillus sp. YX66 TaxID=3229242 RepID=UPI00358D96AD
MQNGLSDPLHILETYHYHYVIGYTQLQKKKISRGDRYRTCIYRILAVTVKEGTAVSLF